MENIDFKQVARQLSNPQGDDGLKTGELMQEGNKEMCLKTIDFLVCSANNCILEIGHGNGSHVSYLLNKNKNINYYGIDISETMVNAAKKINKGNTAQFTVGNGKELPYKNQFFDEIFTVNTIYFWEDPEAFMSEINRVLKPGGQFNLAFRSKDFMTALPFTQYGFSLYSEEDARNLLEKSGFMVLQSHQKQEEESLSSIGHVIKKDHIIMVSQKAVI